MLYCRTGGLSVLGTEVWSSDCTEPRYILMIDSPSHYSLTYSVYSSSGSMKYLLSYSRIYLSPFIFKKPYRLILKHEICFTIDWFQEMFNLIRICSLFFESLLVAEKHGKSYI